MRFDIVNLTLDTLENFLRILLRYLIRVSGVVDINIFTLCEWHYRVELNIKLI